MSGLGELRNIWCSRRSSLGNGLAKSFTVAALPAFAFVFGVGTGGYTTPEFLYARGKVGYLSPFVHLRDVTDIVVPNATNDLDLVLNLLQLNHSQLSRLLGVSRQTIYNWLAGDNIAETNAAKLADLASAARIMSRYDIKAIRALLKRKFSGKTLFEAFEAGQSANAFAQRMVVAIDRENVQRNKISERTLGKLARPSWANEFFMPHLSEEG